MADVPDPSREFSVVASSSTFALSHADAVAMFLVQLSAGQVHLETFDAEAEETEDFAGCETAIADLTPDQRVGMLGWLLPNPEVLTAHERRQIARCLRAHADAYVESAPVK